MDLKDKKKRIGYEENLKKFLAILAVIILAAFIGQIASIVTFNHTGHRTAVGDTDNSVYLEFDNRADSTGAWQKRGYKLDRETVDLNARTIDGNIYNNTDYEVSDWTLQIDIDRDCFINNAWCGTVEIHQYVGDSREAVQTLDLRNYKLDEVKLDYLYDGDLLIPLKEGDYLIYYPSIKESEIPVKAHGMLTFGVIFYYLDEFEITDYYMDYELYRSFFSGSGFYAIAALCVIWLVLYIVAKVAKITYERAMKELELQRQGIACMSDIYQVIYIIDLEQDTLMAVGGSDEGKPGTASAYEYIRNMIDADAEAEYMDMMIDFCNFSTLPARLEKKNSIVCEYKSKRFGWNNIRIFAMDREEGQPISRVLFTIQDINEEKRAMEESREQIAAGFSKTNIPLNRIRYSLGMLIDGLHKTVAEEAGKKGLEFSMDVSKQLPDGLYGDVGRLRQILSYLLNNAVEHSDDGRVGFSVYGKVKDDILHLLFTVHGTAGEVGIDLVKGLLEILGSELHVIKEDKEVYFETDQKIVDLTPIMTDDQRR